MPYRRRYRRRRKNGFNKRVAKVVASVTGVPNRDIRHYYSSDFFVASNFGQFAIHSQCFRNFTEWQTVRVLCEDMRGEGAPDVGGADEPPSTDSQLCGERNGKMKFTFHNSLTESYEMTVWWLLSKETFASSTISRPSQVWEVAYNLNRPLSGSYGLGNFVEDFMTYPTYFKEFKNCWEIKKKTKTVMNPGDTKVLYCKMKNYFLCENDWTLPSAADNGILANHTYAIMIQLKGVPTCQNDGTTVDTSKVDFCKTHLEVVYEYESYLQAKTNFYKVMYANPKTIEVTAARSQIPEVTTTVTVV